MGVRIDKTREHVFAAGVDDFRARRRSDVVADARDGLRLAEDVRHVTFTGSHDFAVFDEQSHRKNVPAPRGIEKQFLRTPPGMGTGIKRACRVGVHLPRGGEHATVPVLGIFHFPA